MISFNEKSGYEKGGGSVHVESTGLLSKTQQSSLSITQLGISHAFSESELESPLNIYPFSSLKEKQLDYTI